MATLVSFGTKQYVPSMELLRHSALEVGGFDRVLLLGEQDVDTPLQGGRGHGSFAWKPEVVLHALREAADGQVVVYADAAIQILKPLPKPTSPVTLFEIGDRRGEGYTVRKYTKPECMQVMCVTEQESEALQVNAAVQMYVAGPEARAFVMEYQRFCCQSSCVGDDPSFPNHRHDQSVLSVLAQRMPVTRLADPTQWGSDEPALLHHRRVLKRMPTLAVVTPTTGRNIPQLLRAMDSVQQQQVVCLRHVVVCDGPEATIATHPIRQAYKYRKPVVWLDLPVATGRDRWNGHRIYAAASMLAPSAHADGPAELLAYLDEDNWMGPDHLRLLLNALLDGRLDAVHSLRSIWSKDGTYVCQDASESLGQIAPAVHGGYRLADTSTWLMTHRAAVASAHCWDVQARDSSRPEADRALTSFLLLNQTTGCVPRHTLNYTAGSSVLSVAPKYFQDTNRVRDFDFAKPCLYLFHFDASRTHAFIRSERDRSRSYLLDEWNMGQPRALRHHFNVIDGFACGTAIPRNSLVLVHVCHPSSLPVELLASRTDLHRVLYTAESPNIRHAQQWGRAFLANLSDVLLTYWEPLLLKPPPHVTAYHVPHNCHHLDLDNPHDERQFRDNRGASGTVCMVLENRGCTDNYRIDDEDLQCLDGLRSNLARQLGEAGLQVTVHGRGWSEQPWWKVGGVAGKTEDRLHAVDILQNHAAALVVENCSARGYVSEKCYDALLAGCVPIFFNGHPTHLPDQVYFNLATTPIAAVTAEAIDAKRHHVLAMRREILEEVSAQSYAAVVLKATAKDGSRSPCRSPSGEASEKSARPRSRYDGEGLRSADDVSGS